jgi:hypothetical protein
LLLEGAGHRFHGDLVICPHERGLCGFFHNEPRPFHDQVAGLRGRQKSVIACQRNSYLLLVHYASNDPPMACYDEHRYPTGGNSGSLGLVSAVHALTCKTASLASKSLLDITMITCSWSCSFRQF